MIITFQTDGDRQPDPVHHPRVVGVDDVVQRIDEPKEEPAGASERNFRLKVAATRTDDDNQIIRRGADAAGSVTRLVTKIC